MLRPSFPRRVPQSRVKSLRRQCLALERLDDRILMAAGLAGGVWTIRGEVGPSKATIDNVIVIDRDPSQNTQLRAMVNGTVVGSQPYSAVRLIKVMSGRGSDEIRIDETWGKIAIGTVLEGGPGDDRIQGGSGGDRIEGGPGADILSGGGGADLIRGAAGNDLIDGGLDNDRLDGGPGSNNVTSGGGQDKMRNGTAGIMPLRFASNDEFRRFLVRAASRRNFSNGRTPIADLSPVALSPPAGRETAAAKPGHSNTNVQVAGVDEADIVKTDGNYLYILSRQELLIVSATQPNEGAAIRSRTALDGYPVAEYLEGDRLTVITRVYSNPVPVDPGIAGDARLSAPGYIYSPPRTKVVQYDISNRAAPSVIEETSLDGDYIDSRSTGGKVYVALQNDIASRVQPLFIKDGGSLGGTYETQAAFLARVRSAKLADIAPTFVTRTGGPSGAVVRTGLLTDPRKTFRPLAVDDQNLLSLVAFDATGATRGPVDSASAVGSYATTLYASKDNVYLLTPRYSADGSGDGSTTITKFSISNGIQLAAGGTVPGQVLNQFSVDEFQGHLRIATTISRWNVTRGEGTRTVNNLYVLNQNGNALDVVGRLEDLAPNERIFSARFDGEKGYLVTFEQVDPLFTLDLSDPRKPKVVAELVIPGFSRYLHPIGSGLLLGVGRDADPSTGRTRDLQISLFDVSDAANPKRIAHTLIAPPSQQWSWSDAEYDHHAISYFPDEKILTIPVSGSVPGADTNGDGHPDIYTYKSSLYVFRVDPATGFKLLGTVDHDTDVRRGVRIGAELYSLADRTLKINHLDDVLSTIGTVTLQTGDDAGYGGPIVAL